MKAEIALNPTEFAEACDVLTDRTDRPTVPEVLPLVNAYYRFPGCGCGGAVHIITDDDNCAQSHADYCAAEADDWSANWSDGNPGPHHKAIARLLQRCSSTQRHRLHVLHRC